MLFGTHSVQEPWPGLQQVFRLTRSRLHLKDGYRAETVVYGITSWSPQTASPEQLIEITRDHWAAIENGTHWVRDVVMGEDRGQVHKTSAPQAFAPLRNLAIALSRLAGFDSVSAAIDSFSAQPANAYPLLGLLYFETALKSRVPLLATPDHSG
jgi:hypothetical protein